MNAEANEAGKPSIDAEKMNAELLTYITEREI